MLVVLGLRTHHAFNKPKNGKNPKGWKDKTSLDNRCERWIVIRDQRCIRHDNTSLFILTLPWRLVDKRKKYYNPVAEYEATDVTNAKRFEFIFRKDINAPWKHIRNRRGGGKKVKIISRSKQVFAVAIHCWWKRMESFIMLTCLN